MSAVIVVLALSSCLGPPGPHPAATVSSTAPGGSVQPLIREPRSLDIGSEPCRSLFSEKQVSALRLLTPAMAVSILENLPTCRWEGKAPRRSVIVTFVYRRNTLPDALRSGILPYTKIQEISGLPVFDQQTSPASSSCTMTVGVSKNQSVVITLNVEDMANDRPVANACEEGHRVVEEVAASLPRL